MSAVERLYSLPRESSVTHHAGCWRGTYGLYQAALCEMNFDDSTWGNAHEAGAVISASFINVLFAALHAALQLIHLVGIPMSRFGCRYRAAFVVFTVPDG